MRIRFQDWPFEKKERVTLHWLRSPAQVGERRQWKMQAVFRRQDQSLHAVMVPWGSLPMLRLGDVYCDGMPTGETAGTPARVRFGNFARAKILGAIAVPGNYGLRGEDLEEWCVIIWQGKKQFVVPCLEIIRAYFALNRMMASELLRPDSFADLCSASLSDGEAHLAFTKHVALASLGLEIVKRVALVLLEPDFEKSWRQVWACTIHGAEGKRPLRVEPPALAGSCWDIVSVAYGHTMLVLQIREFSPSISLPFSSITYAHPGFRKNSGERAKKEIKRLGGGNERTIETVENFRLHPGCSSPKSLSSPQTIQIAFTSASFLDPIKMVKEQKTDQHAVSDGAKSTSKGVVVREPVPSKETTLNEEAGKGDLPAVEFRPFKSLEEVSRGFRKLFTALNHIDRACISYCEGSSPVGCNLPRLPKESGLPRPHVLVCVSVPGKRFFLVEVDISDGHKLSTLVFVVAEDQEITSLGEKILEDGISAGGHWDKTELAFLLGGREFELVKHTNSSPENWGRRIWKAGNKALSH